MKNFITRGTSLKKRANDQKLMTLLLTSYQLRLMHRLNLTNLSHEQTMELQDKLGLHNAAPVVAGIANPDPFPET